MRAGTAFSRGSFIFFAFLWTILQVSTLAVSSVFMLFVRTEYSADLDLNWDYGSEVAMNCLLNGEQCPPIVLDPIGGRTSRSNARSIEPAVAKCQPVFAAQVGPTSASIASSPLELEPPPSPSPPHPFSFPPLRLSSTAPPITMHSFFVLSGLAASALAQTYSATYTPGNAPNQTEQGQEGTNACGTTNSQTSMCQNSYST